MPIIIGEPQGVGRSVVKANLLSKQDMLFAQKTPIFWKAGHPHWNADVHGSSLNYNVAPAKDKVLKRPQAPFVGTEARFAPSLEHKKRPCSAPSTRLGTVGGTQGHWVLGVNEQTRRYRRRPMLPDFCDHTPQFRAVRKKVPTCVFGSSSRFPSTSRDTKILVPRRPAFTAF
eukprot:TRINITY_DN11806_c0_g1_i1.p2 TRINITY_DN11806_c0_g1~~TRINITY_DN11806_c0_g1_i1.p2  ORF type:complete len:172 (+),score=29.30 TRINITY_DN11806_c0_g1_i1:73-588(+)